MPRKREPDHEQNLVEASPSTYAGSMARPDFLSRPPRYEALRRPRGRGEALY
jgi:hypothetical protein